METVIMELIVHSGNARSRAMEAIKLAKTGQFVQAKEKIKECEDNIGRAHGLQTRLIQDEASGKKSEVSLLVVHAQDHLMNAITVKDLAKEFVDMYEIFNLRGDAS